jgi:hypothetical protein
MLQVEAVELLATSKGNWHLKELSTFQAVTIGITCPAKVITFEEVAVDCSFVVKFGRSAARKAVYSLSFRAFPPPPSSASFGQTLTTFIIIII